MHGGNPAARASDEVIEAIAAIEVQRREMEREGGLTASCSAALRKLHELLDLEKEALQLSGPDAGLTQNVATVAAEIERVKGLTVARGQGPAARNPYPGQRKLSWQNADSAPARNKGRRTMGRAGGR